MKPSEIPSRSTCIIAIRHDIPDVEQEFKAVVNRVPSVNEYVLFDTFLLRVTHVFHIADSPTGQPRSSPFVGKETLNKNGPVSATIYTLVEHGSPFGDGVAIHDLEPCLP